MKRQNSLRSRTTEPNSEQSTLTNFLRPRSAQQASTSHSPPVTRSTIASESTFINDLPSSDEDELAATHQIFGNRQPITRRVEQHRDRSPEKKAQQYLHEPDSPPTKTPVLSGSFNLMALLADRTIRLEEKQTMSRLENSRSASPLQVTNGTQRPADLHTSHNKSDLKRKGTSELMSAEKGESRMFWRSVGNAQDLLRPISAKELDDFSSTFLSRFLSSQAGNQAKDFDLIQVCASIATKKQVAHSDRYLCNALIEASAAREVMIVQNALIRQAQVSIHSLTILLQNLLGVPNQLSEAGFLTSQHPLPLESLRRLKLSSTLRIISARARTIKIELYQGIDLTRAIILLHLDSTYGKSLCADLSVALRSIFQTMKDEIPALLYSLTDVTTNEEYQLHILHILPTDPAILAHSQRLAALFFLKLSQADAQKVVSWQDCLRVLIRHLQSSLPFHPLTSSTSYEQITRYIALLGYATICIPSQCSELTMDLINHLQSLHGRIVDGKAAFISRSEAKGALQRLSDRLKYTLEAQKRKSNVFERFR